MSVINKMLRDLDQRHGGTAQPGAADQAVDAQRQLRQGTASVSLDGNASSQRTRAAPQWRMWLMLAALALALAAGAWLWRQADSTKRRAGQTSVAAVAPALAPVAAASQPVSAPLAASAAVASISALDLQAESHGVVPKARADDALAAPSGNPATGSMALRMEPRLSARRALDALMATPAPIAAPVVPVPPSAAVQDRAVASAPVTRTTAALTPPGDAAPAPQRQQHAGEDAIAQAQALWTSGAHEPALELMQQSIAVAERNAKAAPAPEASPVLLALVRETTRMQLADGRFGAVWELLTRLEPLLTKQPDLWAIRANAAQRLGRHTDSVHAYMMALQSRPDEQRWLLGTAVSLAALGQTANASEMAQRARAIAPVSKDVLAYLRQNGVALKEP